MAYPYNANPGYTQPPTQYGQPPAVAGAHGHPPVTTPLPYNAQSAYGGAQPPMPTSTGVYAPSARHMNDNQELMEWFRAVDTDGSGAISVPELNAALSSAGVPFSLATTEKLLHMYDKNHSGEITFNEFKDLHHFILSMREGFRKRDSSGDGRLDSNEVRAALVSSGYQVSEQTFQALMRKFDRQRRGSLGFDDYVELSIFICRVRNVFAFYDRERTGQVTFTFDTFIGGSVSIL
ncbi:programmed cell death 6 protein-like protein [Leishmania donovani]|uniref:Programmed_cell_death_6_protein-like_protein n=3 Tax=Leishmania donovani species complex TaxID=38574 RepID=A0A6L0WSK7_LEIIN|nr:programmed cell death 6 protein-like protein [Leishmania infantum JPCM5]XP_003859360.1 programmed cell death 6 protein-like protein [Leishmania donovani]CAC9466880.1 programmed_cell_death_6_protein-like_protein [Leishmania infantum]AYU77216.1 programmed cell death 6 protein-like protein [Leishmania donovani]TPP50040.1 EF-hand domain family protein [Leishmania donovani]CAJ1987239.1 programmed cell death 6 protein-like protein [Leishmania donovani]CAM66541.1 programmed cell death 6 protein-l|eukprot:XP_001464164.1 programmed cell death 6 protein-like protein [Leishmania infantum JPCM5]